MVLGLGGCLSSGMSGLIKRDWTYYLKNPGGYWDRETLKQDWTDYLKNPGGYWDWESLKNDWTEFWNLPMPGVVGNGSGEVETLGPVP